MVTYLTIYRWGHHLVGLSHKTNNRSGGVHSQGPRTEFKGCYKWCFLHDSQVSNCSIFFWLRYSMVYDKYIEDDWALLHT